MHTHHSAEPICEDHIREEIRWFEERLHDIGNCGDCAYERALSTTYHTLLAERRQQLDQIAN